MKDLQTWMDRYADSHQNSINQKNHYICVPLIMFFLFGLLWESAKPIFLAEYVWINWSMLLASSALTFYLFLSVRLFFVMVLVFLPFLSLNYYLHVADIFNLWLFYGFIFVFAWIVQFTGRKIEGKKPSFFEDLLFLFGGPIWVFIKIPLIEALAKFKPQR